MRRLFAAGRGVILAAACGAILAAGCAAPPAPPTAEVEPSGLRVRAEAGVERVELRDPDGLPVLTRRLPSPAPEVALPWSWSREGTWTATVTTGEGTHTLAVEVAGLDRGLVVKVEAPVGQDAVPLAPGDTVEVPLVDGHAGRVAVSVQALRAGEVSVRVGAQVQVATLAEGERLTVQAEVRQATPVVVEGAGVDLRATLEPRPVSLEALGRALSIRVVDLPADDAGLPELSRPAGRVTLPAAWWRATLRALGLGLQAHDPWAPWAHVGVVVANAGDQPTNVLVRLQVEEEGGGPAPAFAPRVREGGSSAGAVQALLRVPARGEARAALPLFVDEALLPRRITRDHRWVRRVEVLPLGLPVAVAQDEAPLYASRGSTVASLGLVGAMAAAGLGAGLLLRQGPRWLRAARTSELMTISLFGSLTFIVGAVGRLLTMGLATVLGPFAALLTGLVDDCLRYALLATLLCLHPRPGTASLAVLVGWLLSGFALGTFGPTDLLFVGGRVFWLESLLWLVGLTRGEGWLDESRARRWLRLSAGLGGASLLASATGLVLHVTLYRLFLADWYVALILALPGFAYVALACALAVPFAESLRRIQR